MRIVGYFRGQMSYISQITHSKEKDRARCIQMLRSHSMCDKEGWALTGDKHDGLHMLNDHVKSKKKSLYYLM